MSVKCPYCLSANVSHPQIGTAVASCIGAISGAASAIYAAVNNAPKSSPYVFTTATLASLFRRWLSWRSQWLSTWCSTQPRV